MIVIIDNNEYHLKKCIKFKDRLIGNMFKYDIQNLLFEKCNSIHTFFMKDKIDVIFLDKNNNILRTISNLKSWKIITCKKAYKVIELPKNTLGKKIKIVE